MHSLQILHIIFVNSVHNWDGGRRHFEKFPYLSNCLTDRHEIWYIDTV